MGTEVSRVTLESQQQPWHPAWSRQWIPQSNKQNDANPQKPQTIGNVLAPPKMKTGWDLPLLSLQEVKKLPSSTQALLLAKRLRGKALLQEEMIAKKWNDWMAQQKWQNGSYSYWCHKTLGRESFFRSGEEGKCYQMLSRQDRRENSIHGTFSSKEVKKRRWIFVAITSYLFIIFLVVLIHYDIFSYKYKKQPSANEGVQMLPAVHHFHLLRYFLLHINSKVNIMEDANQV